MIVLKSQKEIEIMAEGGAKLSKIKKALAKAIKVGVRAAQIESLANEYIKAEGGKASFKTVPGYSWATCINVNDGLVHGIPRDEIIFKSGDLISVDIGMLFQGFHTDTSFSVALDPSPETKRFLEVGRQALKKAISMVSPGNHIWDVSRAIEQTVKAAGYSPIRALVGHGIGKELHEDPQIPCFVPGKIEESPEIKIGMTLAIEVMYALGSPDVVLSSDGWTIATRDGKISGLFEETVAVTASGTQIIT